MSNRVDTLDMRCKTVIQTLSGEFRRCDRMLHNHTDEYCYYHAKTMSNLCDPDITYASENPDRPVAYYRLNRDNSLELVRVVDESGYSESVMTAMEDKGEMGKNAVLTVA